MSIGLVLGLVAALCWGSTDVSAAFAGRRLGSVRVAALVQLASLVAIVVLVIVRASGLPADPADLAIAMIAGAIAALAYVTFFTALRIGPVSVVSPVVSAYGGVTVILAVVLRNETLTPLQAFGAALVTTGVVLTGLVADGGWRSTRLVGPGVLFASVAMLCFAALTIVLAGPIRSAGWLPVLFASRIANAATVWLVLAVVLRSRSARVRPLLDGCPNLPGGRTAAVGVAVLGGLLDIGGFVAFAIALEQAPTWIVGLASSFGPVVSVVVAVGLWRERLRPNQWLGLAGLAAGLVAVALP
ncbi:MAG TPA: EamA family transporter [Candidatus Limnocylindrales bacterium]|nr:EamA family transporter [Candidatus Limnocylindrales bacterium]